MTWVRGPFWVTKKPIFVSGFVSENGCKTKTHQTKCQQSNIIGSRTISDKKESLLTTWEKTVCTFLILSGNGTIRIFEIRNWYPKFCTIWHTCLYTQVFIPKVRKVRFLRTRETEQYFKKIIEWPCNWWKWHNLLDVSSMSSFFLLLMSLSVPMYVGWGKRRRFTQIVFPPWQRIYPKSTSARVFVPAQTLIAVKLLHKSSVP